MIKDWLQPHPNPRLQAHWNLVQIGLVLLPFSAFGGAFCLSLASLRVWKQQFNTLIRRPLNWGLGILTIWLILSASVAFNPGTAFLGLPNFVPFFIVFSALAALLQTANQLRRIAWILTLTSIPVVVIGLGQQFWGWAGHPQILWILLDWQIEPTGNPPGRMASIFTYANVLASYLIMVFPLAIPLWLDAFQAWRGQGQRGSPVKQEVELEKVELEKVPPSSVSSRSNPIAVLSLVSLAIVGDLVALLLTDSRNGWAIAVLVGLAFAVYQGWRWLVAGVATIAGIILWSAFGPNPLRQWLRAIVPAFLWARLSDELYPNRPLAELRTTQWQFAWHMTEQRPWTGWGLRNFTPLYQDQMHLWLGHPHNLVLMLTAEAGIPAALLLLGLVAWVMAQAVLLLTHWLTLVGARTEFQKDIQRSDRRLFFGYLMAFAACSLFALLDVTLFDLRINTLGWLLLAGIAGLVYNRKALSAYESDL